MKSAASWLVFAAFFSLLFFIFPIQGLSALDAEVFSGYVLESSKYTTASGDGFVLSYIYSEDKVAVDFGWETLIIGNKSCSKGSHVEGCFNGGRFKEYNYSISNRAVYEYSITLGMLVPKISISKSVGSADIEIGQEAEVQVNITNSGASPAIVRFVETIPVGLKLVEIPGQPCQLSGTSSLVMTESLKPGDVKRCKYDIRALMPGTFALDSKAEFESTKAETVKFSASITVLQPVVSITTSLPSNVSLGEKLSVAINLSSKDPVDSFFFTALIPSRIKPSLVSKGLNAEKGKEGLAIAYGSAFTSLNGTVGLNVDLQAAFAGTSVISANATWIHNGTRQSIVVDFLVNVTLAKPYLRIAKYDAESEIAYGEIINPSHVAIVNVTASFAGGSSVSTGIIGSQSHFSFELTGQQPGNITGKITYYTSYGQELSTPAPLFLNSSGQQPASNESVQAPPSAREEKNAEAPAPTPETPQEAKPVKKVRQFKPSDRKTAVILTGIIIAAIAIFFTIKAKKLSEKVY